MSGINCKGDRQAFAELYERHVASVYRWLDRRMGWLAADLTAETFTRAWLHRDRFRDNRDGAVLPWLLTMLIFLAMVTYIPAISLWLPHALGML